MKVDDDANCDRFSVFNQFPKYLTKANIMSSRGVPALGKGAKRVC